MPLPQAGALFFNGEEIRLRMRTAAPESRSPRRKPVKRTLTIAGECIAWFAVLVFVKTVLGRLAPETADHAAVSFVFCFAAGTGSVFIYRMNARKARDKSGPDGKG